MVALIDFDSLLYKAVYRIVSVKEIREALTLYGKEGARQWLLEEVYNEGINRCENELLKTQNYLQSIFFQEITSWELYITTCTNNFRNDLTKTYKKSRKRNSYVWLLREHYKHNGSFYSDRLEADDLMANRSKELGKNNCIIVSIDKDLKTLGGYYWSYYKQKAKDGNGDFVLNEHGHYEMEYKHNDVVYISEDEADKMFYTQMLMGDKADDINGIKGVGIKTAEKILNNSKNYFIATARKYIEKSTKEEFRLNHRLIRLGTE